MRKRNSSASLSTLRRLAMGFGLVGGLLFIRVWWPIQAERNLGELRKIEVLVFQKKSELNVLNDRYSNLTSLTVLDQWSKRHGPWVPTNSENVIALQ